MIERTAQGYSAEANQKYIRDVIAVLVLEEAKPVTTPSVKGTPTTESLVELENERRAMYRTVVGKLLHMCQERADTIYNIKETARKIARLQKRGRGLGRMKHVLLKYMFVQDAVEKKTTNLAYINTKQNKADLMTSVTHLKHTKVVRWWD